MSNRGFTPEWGKAAADEIERLTDRLAASEAERVTPETILAVAELHGTIYDLRQLLETAVDAFESAMANEHPNDYWRQALLNRDWYDAARKLTTTGTIPVRFAEGTPMEPVTARSAGMGLMDANRPYPDGIAWDEAWRQRQRADNAEALLREAVANGPNIPCDLFARIERQVSDE